MIGDVEGGGHGIILRLSGSGHGIWVRSHSIGLLTKHIRTEEHGIYLVQ